MGRPRWCHFGYAFGFGRLSGGITDVGTQSAHFRSVIAPMSRKIGVIRPNVIDERKSVTSRPFPEPSQKTTRPHIVQMSGTKWGAELSPLCLSKDGLHEAAHLRLQFRFVREAPPLQL